MLSAIYKKLQSMYAECIRHKTHALISEFFAPGEGANLVNGGLCCSSPCCSLQANMEIIVMQGASGNVVHILYPIQLEKKAVKAHAEAFASLCGPWTSIDYSKASKKKRQARVSFVSAADAARALRQPAPAINGHVPEVVHASCPCDGNTNPGHPHLNAVHEESHQYPVLLSAHPVAARSAQT